MSTNSFNTALAYNTYINDKAQTVVCLSISVQLRKRNPPNLRLKRIPVLQQLNENWNKRSFPFFFTKNGAAYTEKKKSRSRKRWPTVVANLILIACLVVEFFDWLIDCFKSSKPQRLSQDWVKNETKHYTP